ncbi:MAG: flagellar basal body rod C-terminal domain-containing protein [Candidatus Margulisiibacteriota bacterium]
MLDILSQAKNAMDAYSTRLRAISANISNVSVDGFKRTDISFQNLFSKLISPGTAAFMNTDGGGTNPLQIGGTVAVSDSSIDFTNGETIEGKQLDIAIGLPGAMFVISPDGGKTFRYTRNGNFKIINDKMVSDTGMVLYGFRTSNGVAAQKLEPIDLSGINYTSSLLSWDENGFLRLYDSANTENPYGPALPYQLAYVTFENPSGLRYDNATTFSQTLSSGNPSTPQVPTVGLLYPRKREKSNVTYSSEVVDSIEVQRSLDAVQSVIKMANDSITAFINKLG